MLSRKFWFHEDDFQQVQFLPFSCWDFCVYHLYEIKRHEEAHSPSGQPGWKKMYNIPATPVAIGDLSISVSDLAAAMPWRLRRANHILSGGWSGAGTRQQNMAAYLAGSCAIVFSWNEDRTINSLWFRDGYVSRWRRGPLLEAVFRIAVLSPMLLVDWRGALVDLSDRDAIRHYLKAYGSYPPIAGDKAEEGDTESLGALSSATPEQTPIPPPERKESLYRFDCPVYPALVTRNSAGDQTQAVLTGSDGQSWALRIDSTSLDTNAEVTPLHPKLIGNGQVTGWIDLAGDNLLVLREYDSRECFEVCDIRDGSIIYSNTDGETAAMTPDGKNLLIATDDGIVIADLTQPTAPVSRTGLFTVFGIDPADDDADLSARLDRPLDHPDSIKAVATGSDNFALAIGDYGYVVAAEVRLGSADEPPLVITERARSFSEGLLYDPVNIVSIKPGESVTVRHGYGCGLTRFDLKTGAETHCPLPVENPEIRYGAFLRALELGGSSGYWVQTDVGPHLWDGADKLTRIADEACSVIATDGERYLGLSPDGWDLIRGPI